MDSLKKIGFLAAGLAVAGVAQGAVVVATETDIAPEGAGDAAYSPTFSAGPSGSDLLEGIAGAGFGDFERELSTGLSALTNGTVDTFYGDGGAGTDHTAYATAGGGSGTGTSADWNLGGAFDITEIVIYGGWNDGGRDQQNADVQVSTDGGTTFTSLGAVLAGNEGSAAPGAAPNDGARPISHRNSITDDAGDLASGVTHIRINFGGVENGYAGYTEVDVFGSAVPEPGSLALLGLGGLAMLRRRRG